MGERISKTDLFNLKNEIRMAEKVNEDKLLPQMREAMERYTSKHVPDIAQDWDIILNEIYPIIQYELPSIFFRNPRVFLKPRNKNYIYQKRDPKTGEKIPIVGDSSKSAKTQEAILNYTLSEIRYKNEVRRVLMDALLFKHGVLWHGYKGEFGMTDEMSLYIQSEKVFVKRISPMNFLFDPAVTLANLDEARWIARAFDVLLDDLMDDETLDIDKKALKGMSGYGLKVEDKPNGSRQGQDKLIAKPENKTLLDYTDKEYRDSTASKFIRVYEVFRRPSKKERNKGLKGSLILFTNEQEKPLRENSWPYKAEGWPARILMFNEVPDSIFGMSDLEVYGTIADQKNSIINLQLRNATENSKVWVGLSKEGVNEEEIDKIQVGDQTIITFEGGNPRDKMFVASPGGSASNELYLLDQRVQNNLDEKVGIPDLKKGSLRSGEESAASVRIRNMGSSLRPAYRQDLMADFLRESCHYLNQLIKEFLPYQDAVRIMGSLDIEWSETPTKEAIQADTDVELDVISMLPEDPEKELQELQTILAMIIQALTVPEIRTKLQEEGKTVNLAPVVENIMIRLRVANPEVFRNIRPEESEGYVSVSEMRQARSNIEAALSGQTPPSAPQPGQDHRARMEAYLSIFQLIESLGDTIAKKTLEGLIQAHEVLLEQETQEAAPRAQQALKLNKPSITPVGL